MTFVSQLIPISSSTEEYSHIWLSSVNYCATNCCWNLNRCVFFHRELTQISPQEVSLNSVKVILKEAIEYNTIVVCELIPSLSIYDAYHTFVFHHSIISINAQLIN